MRTVSKTVTTHYVPLHVEKNCLTYDKVFADIRASKEDKMNRCFRCDWPFQISGSGEVVSAVDFRGHGKKLVCEDCANWILGADEEVPGDE